MLIRYIFNWLIILSQASAHFSQPCPLIKSNSLLLKKTEMVLEHIITSLISHLSVNCTPFLYRRKWSYIWPVSWLFSVYVRLFCFYFYWVVLYLYIFYRECSVILTLSPHIQKLNQEEEAKTAELSCSFHFQTCLRGWSLNSRHNV